MIEMNNINTVMEELEDETKYILVDGKPVSLKAVVDRILNKDTDKKRKLGDG